LISLQELPELVNQSQHNKRLSSYCYPPLNRLGLTILWNDYWNSESG